MFSKTQCSTRAKKQLQGMSLKLQPAPLFSTPCHKTYCATAPSSTQLMEKHQINLTAMGLSQLCLNKTTKAKGNVCFPTGYDSTENVLTVALQGSSQSKTTHWSKELTEPCYRPLFPQPELSSLLKVLGVWNFREFFSLPDKQVGFCL